MKNKYYPDKSDKEIEVMISELTPFQRKKFEVSMINLENQRQALLVACFYPLDLEEKNENKRYSRLESREKN